MCPCIWVPQPGSCNRQTKVMYKRITGAGAAYQGDQLHREFIHFFSSLDNGSYKAVVGVCSSSGFSPEVCDLHIFKPFCIQVCTQFFEDVFRLLVGHKAEIHFGRCLCRQNCFRAWTLISTGKSADGTGGNKNFLHLEVCAAG